MPRERVHHGTMFVHTPRPDGWVDKDTPGTTDTRTFVPGEKLSKEQYITEEPSLDVSWQRDLWVQVSIDIPRDKWLEIAKEIEAEKDLNSKSIYTETLSRYEINQMIKALRKARDQAFGADE